MTDQTLSTANTTNKSPVAAEKTTSRKVRRVMDTHMRIADNITWKVVVPIDWTIEDLDTPEAWLHVAKRMNRGDTVIAYADDMAWRADFVVLTTETVGNSTMVKLRLLTKYTFTEEELKLEPALAAEYDVKWKGQTAGFGVFRKSDSVYIRDGFQDRPAAHAWLSGYIKSQKH